MRKHINTFVTSEDGAITVDWVVLTALVVGLQVMLMVMTMQDSMVSVSDRTADRIDEYNLLLQ